MEVIQLCLPVITLCSVSLFLFYLELSKDIKQTQKQIKKELKKWKS